MRSSRPDWAGERAALKTFGLAGGCDGWRGRDGLPWLRELAEVLTAGHTR
ncbi:hypothetical protein ACGF0J_14520 [Nonomuraea sp. NPDC047897]